MAGRQAELRVERSWSGEPALADEGARIALRLDAASLHLRVDAAHHGDPPPPAPPGHLDGLWEYEVVEVFLLGDDERYLEVELAPHGHHLVLALHGVRRRVGVIPRIDYTCRITGSRWHGEARLDAALLPRGRLRANAYAMHGRGAARRHLAAHPPGGAEPDFHRLDAFRTLEWSGGDGTEAAGPSA